MLDLNDTQTISVADGGENPKPANSSLSAKKEKIFFPNLDGIRFFCFLAVFLLHSFVSDDLTVQSDGIFTFMRKYVLGGAQMGVNFFFVLSGFLITYLLIKEKEFTQRIHIGNFYIRRILRIWPLFFFNVIFGFFIFPWLKTKFGQVPNETAHIKYYLVFLNNFDMLKNGIADSSMLNVLWSVAIEEQFYLVWPVLLFLVPAKHYKALLLSIITISFIFRCFTYQLPRYNELHTLSVISDMAIGGLGATLAIQHKRFLAFLQALTTQQTLIIYLTLFVLYFLQPHIFIGPLVIIDRLVFSILFIAIILEQNYSGSVFKLSNFRLISKLGTYTYSLYCLHMIGVLIVTTLFAKFHIQESVWKLAFIKLPLEMLLSIGIALISYHLFEKHFLRLKDKFAFIVKR